MQVQVKFSSLVIFYHVYTGLRALQGISRGKNSMRVSPKFLKVLDVLRWHITCQLWC